MTPEPGPSLRHILIGVVLLLVGGAGLLFLKVIPFGEALLAFIKDVFAGEPVALILAGFVVGMALLVAAVWIVDYFKRVKPKKRQRKESKRGKPGNEND